MVTFKINYKVLQVTLEDNTLVCSDVKYNNFTNFKYIATQINLEISGSVYKSADSQVLRQALAKPPLNGRWPHRAEHLQQLPVAYWKPTTWLVNSLFMANHGQEAIATNYA